jgi:hypothetical protein
LGLIFPALPGLHPLYPVERVTAKGQVEFQPLWVGLRDTSINAKEVEDGR